ncbi:MAG TPA: hypothetical protein VH934_07960 [Xanthobacteraceae bacterium]|jgi:hypothetical protein
MSSFDAAVSVATIEGRWARPDCSHRVHHTGAAFECANAATATAHGAAFGMLMREIETAAESSIPGKGAAGASKRAVVDPAEVPPPEVIVAGG